MKHYYKILLLLLLCQGLGLQAQQSFRQQHAAAYQQALAYLEANKALIRQELPAKQAAAILAIGFPEMVRHHLFKDFIETKILEALYIRYGSTYADFSIGIFQMKPSFIEALEDLVRSHKLAQKHPIFPLAQEAEAQRQERLARLQDFGWQLRYLHAFYEVAQKHFGQKEMAFLASAYNLGLHASVAEVQAWQQVAAFPEGRGKGRIAFVYAQISLEFYEEFGKKGF
jgi:hypothetical protein